MMKKALAALMLAGLLAACSKSTTSTTPSPATTTPAAVATTPAAVATTPAAVATSPAATAAKNTVTIKNFQFTNTNVSAGATVQVMDADTAPHTLTATDGSFTTETIAAGATGSFTAPAKAGSYPIKCKIHPNMSGTLVVS